MKTLASILLCASIFLSSIHGCVTSQWNELAARSRTNVGTLITGAGSHSHNSRSIFQTLTTEDSKADVGLSQVSAFVDDMKGSILGKINSSDAKKEENPLKGRLLTRLTEDGKLLFYFPHFPAVSDNEDGKDNVEQQEPVKATKTKRKGTMISLATSRADGPLAEFSPTIIATVLDDSNDNYDLSEEMWIPIEGIFGVYMLPSGPHLVLITASEETYKSHDHRPTEPTCITTSNAESNTDDIIICTDSEVDPPILNLRKVLSMEIVAMPTQEQNVNNKNKKTKKRSHKRYPSSEEIRQFHLLRKSLKEHEFYFVTPESVPIVQDITHTLQRSFSHWASEKVRKEENDDLKKVEAQQTTDEDSSEAEFDSDDGDTGNETHQENEESKYNAQEIKDLNDPENMNSSIAQNETQSSSEVSWWWSYLSNGDKPSWWGKFSRINTPENNSTEAENTTEFIIDADETKIENSLGKSWWSLLLDEQENRTDNGEMIYQRPDSRFFWNEESMTPLLQCVEDSNNEDKLPFHLLLNNTIPVTSAFVGVQKNIALVPDASTNVPFSVSYDQILISRRSKYRAGTRFTRRGSDATGDVANFAETEQICIVRNETEYEDKHGNVMEVYSHVQTRGSIPLRWSSPTNMKTYRPKVMIGIDPLAQARALRSHLIEQLSLYCSDIPKSINGGKNLVFINLIDKHSDQGRLGRTFSTVLDAVLSAYDGSHSDEKNPTSMLLNPRSVSHVWFDFHAECKKGRWDRLKYLLEDVQSCLDSQGYFCAVPNANSVWEIIQIQNGSVRTNCMDCLDRTNVVQSMFGRYILYQQFSNRIGMKQPVTRKLPLGYTMTFKQNMLTLPWTSGEVAHRSLWADNADAISRLYAGTPALKGDFTRTGKRTKRGALDDGMNSLQRFYLNNFIDTYRQEGMDLLTGFANFDAGDSPEDTKSVKALDFHDDPERLLAILSDHRMREIIEGSDSRLSLTWLPGDLQSHLRSAALSSLSRQDGTVAKRTSELSLSSALSDIDRRSMLNDPWWVIDSEDDASRMFKGKRGKELSKQAGVLRSSSSAHVIGALIASSRAPIATALACICFMIPGFFHSDE